MPNIYKWQILQLDLIEKIGNFADYVYTAHWQCTGSDGKGHSGQVYSTVSFPVDPDKPNYVPYADLTEAEVIAWTQEAIGEEQIAAVYASIDNQIENQINPPIVSPALPWSKHYI